MTDAPFTEMHRRLTQALLDYWVRHKSTTPGEVGAPENVFYNVKTAVDVLVPVFDRLQALMALLPQIVEALTNDTLADAPTDLDDFPCECEDCGRLRIDALTAVYNLLKPETP